MKLKPEERRQEDEDERPQESSACRSHRPQKRHSCKYRVIPQSR